MKKRIGSFNLLSIIGIGAAIGFIVALWDIIVFIIPFEREWITYAVLVILVIMSVRIGLIWKQSKKQASPKIDIDEQNAKQEKIAYKFVGATSLFLIIGTSAVFIALLEWQENNNLHSTLIVVAFFATFLYGIYAQLAAINFHNKHNPEAFLNWKKTDGYKEYFENLDEGEKFEQYRVAYKSFYAMNLLFPGMIFALYFVSLASSPQYVAIIAVGILWFIMYMIYYREGAKSH